jgi:hypothetical protein
MKLLLAIITAWVMALVYVGLVHAGSNFTELSKSTEIVDWDKWVKAKVEAEEYARKLIEQSSDLVIKPGATVVTSSTTITRMRP